MKKFRFLLGIVLILSLVLTVPALANISLQVPTGVGYAIDRDGNTYTPDANGRISVPSKYTSDFQNAGYVPYLPPYVPLTPGGVALGTNPLPFSSAYIGAAATNNIQITGTATGARVATFPDATGNVVLDSTNPTDGQVFIPAGQADTLYAGTTPWTRVIYRNAAGDWDIRQTSGNSDNTMQMAFHLGPALRKTTASKGLKITGFSVAHKVATQTRGAGTVTLKKVVYSTSANAVTDMPVTGSLGTTSGTYLDAFTVTTPYWMVDANADFVIDIAVAATTSGCVWDVAGVYVTYTTAPY